MHKQYFYRLIRLLFLSEFSEDLSEDAKKQTNKTKNSENMESHQWLGKRSHIIILYTII